MKKINLITVLILFAANLFAAPTWDLIDKSMTAWNVNDGSDTDKAWSSYIGNNLKNNPTGYSITQGEGFVNLTKTHAEATNASALINSAGVAVATNTPYTIEFKARINPINKTDFPDVAGTGWELNAISSRVNKKTTDIYLGYAEDARGYVTLNKNYPSAEAERVYLDISVWHVYSLVLSADNTKFDLYIDGELVFENAPTADMNSASNIMRFGTAAERSRCNIDVQYAKMGTGDFYSKARISSVALSHNNHVAGNESTVSITANTLLVNDGEKLLFSLIDGDDTEIVAPVEGTVTNNVATADLVIPANIPDGNYFVKAAAPNGQIGGVDVAPKTIPYLIEESDTPPSIWDVLDKSMAAWNADGGKDTNKAWNVTKGKDISLTPTQENGYVNITKTVTKSGYAYGFITPQDLTLQSNTAYSFAVKARVNAINKTTFPDTEDGFESIEISARLNTKNMAIYLKHGDENTGYISLTEAMNHDDEDKYRLNTSEWHIYRFVFYADNSKYDVYIDDIEEPIFENIETSSMTGSNILRLGAGSYGRCNLDIESVKIATGDLYSKAKIVSTVLSSDSHVENNARTITVTANTVLIDDAEKLLISLVDGEDNAVVNAIEATVSQNKAETSFTIPGTVAKGKYYIKAAAPDGKIGDVEISPKTADYVVVAPSPITSQLLPKVSPVGFIKDIADYQYIGPSKEFISPTILDIKPYLQNGKFLNQDEPFDRYYLFYSPHENPGGMYLATAPTLDGPWTERNTVIDLDWAKAIQGSNVNTASHISACHIIWNDIHNKYFMYFHGPNTTTHYATSDNLKDWTFGKSILNAQNFGSRGNEASYSKIFEHEVPGLDNKYIMLMMIAETSSSRRVYWAHSKDGVDWTGVRKPLISADLDYKKIPGTDIKPNYVGGIGNNVAASFLMESDGRYFVFFNGSSGNICVAEVGEALDMEVHWGEYMKAADVIIDKDDNGNLIALPRAAAPMFITDDAGKWYMFFEAGSRLGANIAYAKEPGSGATREEVLYAESVAISATILNAGQALSIETVTEGISLSEVALYSLTGNEVYRKSVSGGKITTYLPVTSGMYILNVRLNNNTSKEFKIIIK